MSQLSRVNRWPIASNYAAPTRSMLSIQSYWISNGTVGVTTQVQIVIVADYNHSSNMMDINFSNSALVWEAHTMRMIKEVMNIPRNTQQIIALS